MKGCTKKKILSIITAIAVVAVGALTAYNVEQNSTTAFSSACKINSSFREFVIQEFGDNDNIESLIIDVNEFISQKEYVLKKSTNHNNSRKNQNVQIRCNQNAG